MAEKSTAGLSPDRLAEMLAIGPAGPNQTPEEALADLLACTLPEGSPPAGTFGAALVDPATSLEVLQALKDYAKQAGAAAESTAEQAAALAVYYAAIAAALVRHDGARLTQMSDEQIRQGLESLDAKDWLPPTIKALLTEARAACTPEG